MLLNKTIGNKIFFSSKKLGNLLEPSEIRKIGFKVANEIQTPLRVFSIRLAPEWHLKTAKKMGYDGPLKVIGGDFLTSQTMKINVMTDPEALKDDASWGSQPCWINPCRTGLGQWVAAIKRQLSKQTGPDQIFWCLMVPIVSVADGKSILDTLPVLKPLFTSEGMSAHVTTVSERAPVCRIPPSCKQIPPNFWENSFSSPDRLSVVIHIQKGSASSPSDPHFISSTEALPAPARASAPQMTLDTLVAEMILPPNATLTAAKTSFFTALKKFAFAPKLAKPLVLGEVHVKGSLAWATLRVPSSQAETWLSLSGQSGLFLRPFFTASTSSNLAKDRYKIMWLKMTTISHTEVNSVWEVISKIPSTCGLLFTRLHVGVRVKVEGGPPYEVIQQALKKIGGTSVKAPASSDLHWWCIEGLKEEETFQKEEIISKFSLKLAPGPFKMSRNGRNRWKMYFRASGTPTVDTLDDGSFASSQARLRGSKPPPQKPPKQPQSKQPGAETKTRPLPPNALWGEKLKQQLSKPKTPRVHRPIIIKVRPPCPPADTVMLVDSTRYSKSSDDKEEISRLTGLLIAMREELETLKVERDGLLEENHILSECLEETNPFTGIREGEEFTAPGKRPRSELPLPSSISGSSSSSSSSTSSPPHSVVGGMLKPFILEQKQK